jgi:hypothetical protein
MRRLIAVIILWFACYAAATAQDAPLKLPIGYVATACGPGFVPCLTPTYHTPTAGQRAALDAACGMLFGSSCFPSTIGIVDSNEAGSIIGTAVFAWAGGEYFLFTPGHPIIFQDSPGCCPRVEYHSLNNNGLVVGGFGGGPILTDVLHGIVLGPNYSYVSYVAYVIPDPRFPNETFGPTAGAYTTFNYINDLNQIDAHGGFYQQRYILTPVSANTKERCKDGAWQKFPIPPGPFQNQGECVSYFTQIEKN